jgi:hypothetical protein
MAKSNAVMPEDLELPAEAAPVLADPPAEAAAVNVAATGSAALPVVVVREFGAHQLGDVLGEVTVAEGVTLFEIVDAVREGFATCR